MWLSRTIRPIWIIGCYATSCNGKTPAARAELRGPKAAQPRSADGDMDFYVAAKAALVAELLTRARTERGLPRQPRTGTLKSRPDRDQTHISSCRPGTALSQRRAGNPSEVMRPEPPTNPSGLATGR